MEDGVLFCVLPVATPENRAACGGRHVLFLRDKLVSTHVDALSLISGNVGLRRTTSDHLVGSNCNEGILATATSSTICGATTTAQYVGTIYSFLQWVSNCFVLSQI